MATNHSSRSTRAKAASVPQNDKPSEPATTDRSAGGVAAAVDLANRRIGQPSTAPDQSKIAFLESLLDSIGELNGTEIGGVLDALLELGDLIGQDTRQAQLIECVRARLQAAKNEIEALCCEAGEAT